MMCPLSVSAAQKD